MSNTTLNNLYNQLVSHGPGTLTLNQTVIPEYLLDSWEMFLKTRQIFLNGPQVSEQDTNGNFTVFGTTNLLSFTGVGVTFTFLASRNEDTHQEDHLECFIRFDSSVPYNLSSDYPVEQGTLLPGYNNYSEELDC